MGSFATGLMQAFGERMHEQSLMDLQQEVGKRRELASMLVKMANDPQVRPEHREEYMRQYQVLLSTPYTKKLPKDVGQFSLQLPVEAGKSVSAAPPPQTMQAKGVGAPPQLTPPPGLTQAQGGDMMSGGASATAPPIAIQPPEPPPPQGPFLSPTEVGRNVEEMERPSKEAEHKRKLEDIRAQAAATLARGQALLRGTTITRDALGGQLKQSNPDLRTADDQPLDDNVKYNVIQRGNDLFAIPAGVPKVTQKQVWVIGPNGKPLLTFRNPNNLSEVVGSDPSAVPPAGYLPKFSSREQVVVQADGSLIKVPFSSTSGVVLPKLGGEAPPAPPTTPKAVKPGAAPPPGVKSPSGKVGERPLPPAQAQKIQDMYSALDRSSKIAKDITDNVDVLDSLKSAIKVAIAQHPGVIGSLATRVWQPTPRETKLAGALISMAEHINTLRGPLGATGFRSQYAWDALLAQRGNPLAYTGITKEVLRNTSEALEVLKGNKKKYLEHYGYVDLGAMPPPGTKPPLESFERGR